jgi:N-acetylmuramoyl-L-alanine amidase
MDDKLKNRLKDIIRDLEDILDEAEQTSEEDEAGLASHPARSPKLAVVVGHTRARPGAIAVDPINEHEYPWNTRLAERMKGYADSKGVPMEIFFRDRVGISGAYRKVADYGASAVIELHFNAFDDPRATGTETLWSTPPSEKLAEDVQQAMVQALGSRDRGAKQRHTGRGVKSLTELPGTPSVLIEPFFGSNPDDAAVVRDREETLARALVDAAQGFMTA